MAFFPNPETADEDGLVAVGGDLSPERLVEAYSRGIFPWYDDFTPILWWSPDPRGIIELDGLHVSRRLRRTLRSGVFETTVNRAFVDVMRGCAERDEGTWIIREMVEAYAHLHRLGFAHSVETWHEGRLAGGIYGVAVGGLFAAESMFYRKTDASKMALVDLVNRLREAGFDLLDVQFLTDHLQKMGATEIPRREYLARLRRATNIKTSFA